MAPLLARGPGPASHVHAGLSRVTMGLRHSAASIQKIKVDFSKVPDWQRRAARLSIAIVFFGILGHCMPFPPGYATLASNFRQSCNWAAITCIVVTAPLIGKVAQVAFDRLLGTAVGGCIGCVCFTLGFHLFGPFGGGVFISLMSGVTVWATTYLAYKRSLDQLVRFVQLTYVIVAFGAKPDKGALLLALLRVGGIFAGGLLGVVLAVLVLPRSASVDCLMEMKKALKALYDLNQEVWALSGVTGAGQTLTRRKPHRHGYSALQLRLDAAAKAASISNPGAAAAAGASFASAAAAATAMHPSNSDPPLGGLASAAAASDLRRRGGVGGGEAAGSGDSLSSLPDGLRRMGAEGRSHPSAEHLDLLVQHDEERDSREAAIEKLFTAVYTALGRVDENLAQTKGEIYIWHFWGRYFFLPGVHWFPVRGRWTVPKKDLEDLATCLRRVARMLWTLLLDFEEGFGSEMESVLQLYYPKQLLSELANYQARAILDLLQAFPGGTSIEVDNLFTLGQVTDCLLQISDARARNTVFKVKRRRAASTAAATPAAATAAGLEAGSGVAAAAAGVGGGGRVLELRRSSEWRRSLELSGRLAAERPADGSTIPTAANAAAAAGPDLEKQPLLAPAALSSTAPAANTVGGAAAPLLPLPGSGSLTDGLAPPPRQGLAAAASGGGGIFLSRLLSGTPGEAVSLHLPPRRFLQEQQQQQEAKAQSPPLLLPLPPPQRQQLPDVSQPVGGAKGEPPIDTAASIDIFGGLQFDALAASLLEPPVEPAAAAAAAADGCATAGVKIGAVSDRGGGAVEVVAAAAAPAVPSAPAAPQQPQRPATATAAAALPPRPRGSLGGVGADAASPAALPLPYGRQPAAAAGGCRVTAFDRSSAPPGWMAAFAGSPAAAIPAVAAAAAAAASTRATDGSPQTPTISSAPSGAATAAASAAATPTLSAAAAAGPPGRGGSGRDGGPGPGALAGGPLGSELESLQRMGSMLSSVLVEPVTFPPTEEGYLTQVRWYSFQFVMDEMVNELEEAFHACSAVLQKLPYPVGN